MNELNRVAARADADGAESEPNPDGDNGVMVPTSVDMFGNPREPVAVVDALARQHWDARLWHSRW